MTQTFAPDWWQEEDNVESVAPIEMNHHVTAIVVSRNGARWLPICMSALETQTRPVDALIAVDISSSDDSAAILRQYRPSDVLELPEGTTQSDAIDAAVETIIDTENAVEWLWLIHDDSAPEPQALEQLLKVANEYPHAAVVGCKVLDWSDPSHVLEVGSSITAIGTRYTGLERGERDQGQHDVSGPVHSVSSVGMLIRRDVWISLNGFSPELAHFRTDLDLCWRAWSVGNEVVIAPGARVRHVSATARSVRKKEKAASSPHFVDRRAGVLIVMALTPRKWLWLRWILIALSGLARGAGYLALQDVVAARDEWRATVAGLAATRQRRRLRRRYGTAGLLPGIRPTLTEQLVHAGTEVAEGLQSNYDRALDALLPGRVHRADVGYFQALLAALRRPGSILALVSVIVGIFATRNAWGSGQLVNAAETVLPTSASELMSEYLSSWHAVGLGSEEPSHPMQAMISVLSYLTFQNPALLVLTLSTFGMWWAAASMHLSLRVVLPHSSTRVWLAALYGLSPVVVESAVTGNVATTLSAIALPPTVVLLGRALTSWRAAAGSALLISIFCATWPATWLMLGLGVLYYVLRLRPGRGAAVRLFAVLLWSFTLLLPWSISIAMHPGAWFGQFAASNVVPASAWMALFTKGAPDSAWWWGAGLVLVAMATLTDSRNNKLSQQAWRAIRVTLLVALIAQAAMSYLPSATGKLRLDIPAMVITAALLLCLASTAATVRVRLNRSAFGWRQLGTALAIISVTALPVSGLVTNVWQRPESDRLHRVPDLSAAALRGYTEPMNLRTLLLTTSDSGVVSADILDQRPVSFGDAEVASDVGASEIASAIATWLTASEVGDGRNPLVDLGVGYVAVPAQDPLAIRIAAIGNLSRLMTARNDRLLNVWRVVDVENKLFITSKDGSFAPVTIDGTQPANVFGGEIDAEKTSRVLTLATRSNERWIATINGRELEREDAFVNRWRVPAKAEGRINVALKESQRTVWLAIAGVSGISVLLVLAPRRRNTYRDEWLVES